jgi:RNA 2',3'-cyclic 3'-phosphodiesterase
LDLSLRLQKVLCYLSMYKRLFLAIPLSKELKKIITERQALIDPSLKWIPAENLHITLHFFGKTEESAVPPLIDKISKVAEAFPPFPLYTKEIGIQAGKFQKMIWVKFIPSPEFVQLSREIAGPLDIKLTRTVLPHVNLIRIKDKIFSLNNLASPVILNNEIVRVKKIELWESRLMPGKFPVYNSLHNFILKGREKK